MKALLIIIAVSSTGSIFQSPAMQEFPTMEGCQEAARQLDNRNVQSWTTARYPVITAKCVELK